MLTCREIVGVLDDYLEGRLPEHMRAEFQKHLAGCTSCAAYARTYEDTVRLARSALADQPPTAAVPEELIEAVLAARKRTRGK